MWFNKIMGRFGLSGLVRGNRAQRSARPGAHSKTRFSIPLGRGFLEKRCPRISFPEGWSYRFADIPASIEAPGPSTSADVRLECATMPAQRLALPWAASANLPVAPAAP